MKKHMYEQRIKEVKHTSFTPLVISATGDLANEASTFYKRLSSLLASIGITPRAVHYAGYAAVWRSSSYVLLFSPSEVLNYRADTPSGSPLLSTSSTLNRTFLLLPKLINTNPLSYFIVTLFSFSLCMYVYPFTLMKYYSQSCVYMHQGDAMAVGVNDALVVVWVHACMRPHLFRSTFTIHS